MPQQGLTIFHTVRMKYSNLFFYWDFTAHQDYFTQSEPSQSLGGRKREIPERTPPGHPQAELGLSHIY